MMIEIKRNGQSESIKKDMLLMQALKLWGYQGVSFAVAINCAFVPRSQFEQTRLTEGDEVEIVTPMQGG